MSNAGDPFAPFEDWAKWETDHAAAGAPQATGKRHKTFTPRTVQIYRSIWTGWLSWLAGQNLQWHTARTSDAHRFLTGPAPGTAGREPISVHTMANYTQQRYWRVLAGVYRHAGPRRAALDPEKLPNPPVVQRRSRQAQLLPPGVLETLQQPQGLIALAPREHPSQWWVARDRAAMALLAHCALTTAELIALRATDLRVGTATLRAEHGAQRLLPGTRAAAHPAVVITEGMPRTLEIPAAALQTLLPWLQERRSVLASLYGMPPDGPEMDDQALFLSRQREEGRLMPMESTSIYQMVRRFVTQALPKPTEPGARQAKVAKGAAIVRNTVLRHWWLVDGHTPQEVARRAGLQSAESLRLMFPK